MTANNEVEELRRELDTRLIRLEKAILNDDFEKARTLVLGDERLGIPHIRVTLKTLDDRLMDVEQWRQQIKWIAAGYGAQGALTLAGIIYSIFVK